MDQVKNMEKYEVYKSMNENLSKAMKAEFYYQAIFIEYAIIEDRCTSVLKHQDGITDESLNTLGRYISRNAKEITERIVLTDAVEDLIMLEPFGILKKNSVEERLAQASKGGAVMCAAWIMQWKNTSLTNKKK